MKARKLRTILRELGYRKSHGKGSHEVLKADGRPTLIFGFHSKDTISGGLVRSILVRQAGLTVEETKEVLGIG